MDSIWDIMISNTDNMNGKRLFLKLINASSYNPDFTEEEMKDIFTDDDNENVRIVGETVAHQIISLIELLNTKDLPAWAVMDVCCNFLSCYPQFADIAYNDSSLRSHGMLIRNGSLETLMKNGVVYDILEPNLYCVLLLEAKGQRLPDNGSCNSKDIATHYELQGHRFKMPRPKNGFPDILRELFAVERTQGKPYRIHTPYWYLLAAELDRIGISPLCSIESTAYSCVENMKFYKACTDAIVRNNDCALDSIADYYLFERFHRLNTKFQLFWSEHQFGTDGSVLSPTLLGEFFYSSPLVLFPDELLSSIFYKPMSGDSKHLYMHGVQTLHFLIQLSSYWFPIVLYLLRLYMGAHDIVSPDDVKSFFFAGSNLFSLGADVMPELKLESSVTKINRALKEDYAEKWRYFSPDRGLYCESLMPLTLKEWYMKGPSETYTLQDKLALKYIQESIYY